MNQDKTLERLMSDISIAKRDEMYRAITTLGKEHNLPAEEMQPVLDSIMAFVGELAADCYSQGFTEGAALGRLRGRQDALGLDHDDRVLN